MSRSLAVTLLVVVLFAITPAAHAACPDFAPAVRYDAGALPLSVASGDFNSDGKPDLATTNALSSSVTIVLGMADGTFAAGGSYSTGNSPRSVAAGDFDGDGRLDLAVVNFTDSNVTILQGDGMGGFGFPAPFGTGAGPLFVAAADFDRNGSLDLAVANSGANTVSILLANGAGGFAPATNFAAGTSPQSIAIADFNGDGKLDLVTANYTSNDVSLLLGDGGGSFGAPASFLVPNTPPAGVSSPTSVTAGDFNGDVKLDLAVTAETSRTVVVLIGTGSGSFGPGTSFGVGLDPRAVVSRDFSGDGVADLAVANYNSSTVSILAGNGSGSFATAVNHATGTRPAALAIGDFDGDGKPDLASANYLDVSVSILLNSSACFANCGTFGGATNFGGSAGGTSVAAGDFDRNGIVDLAVANRTSNSVSVLLGSGGGSFGEPSNHAVGTSPVWVATADFNRDGKLDIATANETSDSVSVLLGNGAGGFGAATNFAVGTSPSGPQSLAVGDFNKDGGADLAVTCATSKEVAILLNATTPGAGTPSFSSSTITAVGNGGGLGPRGVSTGDFNGDGKLDLAVADYGSGVGTSNVLILWGVGLGGFGPAVGFAAQTGPQAVGIGDFNGDGKPDLAVVNFGSNSVSIRRGFGNNFGTAVNVSVGTNPFAIAVGDVNHDGKLDLAVVNRGGDDLSILLGNGMGGFATALPATHAAGTTPSSVVAADLDRDGKPDLAVANSNGTANVSILRNSCPPPDLTVTKIHSSSFSQGGQYSYTITVNNIAAVPTQGPVTVTDTLPAGLTATAMSGSGWVCTLGTRTCTRSDTLSGNSSYEPITLTVGVASNAPALVNNMATVSGGGDASSANNTAIDPTTITPAPDMTLAKTHSGNFAQGQINVLYTITVSNSGGAASSGGVTVTDTLPASMTATAMSGSGWVCTLGTRTCTRSDVLGATSSYPVITLAVNVAGNAPASVTNTATVSGGGQLNTANDLASDPTTINRVAHCGLFAPPVNYIANTSPKSIATGDFNGDGKLDLAVANFSPGKVSILTGSGTGTFAFTLWFTVGTGPVSVARGDLNGDGKLDLAVANQTAGGVSILIGNGDATFATAVNYPVGTSPSSVAIRDLNGDGKLDLVVANQTAGGVSILMGNGNGTFIAAVSYAAGPSPQSVAIGDVNGDGKLDLAVASSYSSVGAVEILLGNGNGTFAAASSFFTGIHPVSVALGDFNGDGKLDLTVANQSGGGLSVRLGNGDGTFAATVSYSVGTTPRSVAIEDFNGDGRQDLAVASGDPSSMSILMGSGDGSFAAAVNYTAGLGLTFVATGDFNGDGRPDLAGANYQSGDVSILLGVCGDLTIGKSHTSNFTQGQIGASYTVTVSNGGPVAIFGTVTMIDSLPEGLTATAISGTGWTCTLSTLTCTRIDGLAASGSYPVITVTVNVHSNAAASVTNLASVSGGGQTNTANDIASDPTTINPSGLIGATRLVATAISTSAVTVVWDAVTTASSYRVNRRPPGGVFTHVGSPSGNLFIDSGLSANTTYLYSVQAVNASSTVGPPSNVDLATTIIFTDDPVVAGSTLIKAVHLTELRTAVDAVRAAVGLANGTYTNSIVAGAIIRAADVTQLRSALDEARATWGFPPMVYSEPAVTSGTTVKAAHIQEVRTGTK